ncbi:MAG: hypothetical protein H6746_05100 [Deltaproteobacteria bacterium]|nr:hypothetical protein [Deltaproteobacteria bacterium]
MTGVARACCLLALWALGACGTDAAAGADARTDALTDALTEVAPDAEASTATPLCQPVPYDGAATEACTFYACADALIAGGTCAPTDYVMGFACKYADRYLSQVHPELSPAGQAFLEGVFVCLQEALVPFVADAAAAQAATCPAVAEAGFGAHVPCYLQNGFCDLPTADIASIALAIDQPDLENPLQQSATAEILTLCSER